MKKILTILIVTMLIAVQTLGACTIFAVGKNASVDGSTMISHTCDSNSDDLRIWLIPSMPAGTERDIVLNGRAGADYSQFPEVKDYGTGGLVLGTYVPQKDTNQYIHAMYSFMNDKGLAMGETTCSYDRSSEHGQKLTEVWAIHEGIIDCYMLQDLTLENCSTAREAVEFMGALVEQYGWNGAAECINICDGEEAWVFEVYGGKIWCAVRVPDNAVFIAANRARINYIDFEDDENYMYADNIVEFALENGLWDGDGQFMPCDVYASNKVNNLACTMREWRVLSLLVSDLELDPFGDADTYPLFVVPDEKLSVETIHRISSDHYQGTEFDPARTVWGGPYGNALTNNYVYRPINMFRCTYIQIAQVNASLPEEVRCLTWFGWGAPSVTYLTPIFASMNELAPHFGIGLRNELDLDSGWWVTSRVQQLSTINYERAIQDIWAVRNPKQETVYTLTSYAQQMAAALINDGMVDEAKEYLTSFANTIAIDWMNIYTELGNKLETKYMLGNVDMRVPSYSDWWNNIVHENLGDRLRPLDE